jgi:hypothetical protein
MKMSNPQSLRASPEGHLDPTRVGRRLNSNVDKAAQIYHFLSNNTNQE